MQVFSLASEIDKLSSLAFVLLCGIVSCKSLIYKFAEPQDYTDFHEIISVLILCNLVVLVLGLVLLKTIIKTKIRKSITITIPIALILFSCNMCDDYKIRYRVLKECGLCSFQ